ncbi:MAG: hypothetical protein GF347_00650 [Candidatus Moranbacteria bacterium]|nr:hypothetical protein [Candidatus Moranbacteria bacterium]
MKERIKSAHINLRDELATIINQAGYFDEILVTITDLQVSNDLKFIKIFVSSMPENKIGRVLKILRKNRFEIIRELSKRVKMKFIPHINFYLDEGYKNYMEVEKLTLNDDAERKI